MDPRSFKSLPAQGPRHPPGLPPGIKVPTGPRSSFQAKRLAGPIEITYEEAIEDIMAYMGEHLADLESIPPVQTSVVLHDPRGGTLKAGEGPILQVDVSLCYLITWLQIFTDNYVEKYLPGNNLVVRSVEIRFNNKLTYTSYPNLEGGLSYFNANGVAAASINWPCDNSLMEQFWEYFRSLMQLGSDDQIKYPIIKVGTVKYLAGDSNGFEVYKPLGSGHIFVVDGKDLDVDRYYEHHGQPIPESLINLDQWLSESEDQQLQNAVLQQQAQTGSHATQMPLQQGRAQNFSSDSPSGVQDPQHGQKANMNPRAYPANTGDFIGSRPNLKTMNQNGPGGPSGQNPAYLLPSIRQQPFTVVSAPIGNRTVDISVPFRPPIHPDPEKTWRKYQRAGGNSQLHNAFPLDHLVYNPKDMPEGPTPPPAKSNLGNEGGQYYMTSNMNNEKAGEDTEKVNIKDQSNNTAGNKTTTRTSKDAYNEIQAAIGFDSDDDDIFFPASCMEEKPKAVDTSHLTQPMHHGHGHRPSQNENTAKGKQAQKHASINAHDPVATDSKAQSKIGLPSKKLGSTMNVNAPEFVTNPAPMHQASGLEFMANNFATGYSNSFAAGYSNSFSIGHSNSFATGYSNSFSTGHSNSFAPELSNPVAGGHPISFGTGYSNPLSTGYSNTPVTGYSNPLAGGYSNQPLHDTSFTSTLKYNPQPFAAPNQQPFMPAPGHYPSYPAPYPPRYSQVPNSGNPNHWALPVYKPTPIGPPKPAMGSSSKPLPTNTASQNYYGHHRGGTKGNDSLPSTVDGLAGRMARQTLGNPSQREGEKECPSNKTGDNDTASQA